MRRREGKSKEVELAYLNKENWPWVSLASWGKQKGKEKGKKAALGY